MKKKIWWRSKTVWVNSLMFVGAIILVFQSPPFMPVEYLIVANSIINIMLRFVTVDSIGIFED